MHLFIDPKTPVDELEPISNENPYREAAQTQALLMNRVMIFVTGAKNCRLAAWQSAFALGLPCCEGKTYTEVAKLCNVGQLSPGKGRAAVSKGAMFFCKANGLPPSFYMKSQEAGRSYRNARIRSIRTINDHNQQLEKRQQRSKHDLEQR